MMEEEVHDDGFGRVSSSSSNNNVGRAIQYWLDKSTIHIVPRWMAFLFLLLLFFLRIYLVQGFFIIAYGLGIFLLNNFIAFLSPLEDPSDPSLSLPTTESDGKEYRPFARRLPEFKFWLSCAKGTMVSIIMTFFSMFDVPVFWPILLMYFGILFFMTMKRQILHMWKHKYIPISFGKSKPKNAGVEHGQFGGGMSKSRHKISSTTLNSLKKDLAKYLFPRIIKVNDTVKVSIETGKMSDIMKFELGAMVMLTGGHNAGRIGQLMHIERHDGSFSIVTVKDTKGNVFSTRLNNVFVIGSGNHPQVTLPKGRGIKKDILQERAEAEARGDL